MLIYRVEDPTGYGPYHGAACLQSNFPYYHDYWSTKRRPTVEYDNYVTEEDKPKGDKWNDDGIPPRFGFASVDQLKDWFFEGGMEVYLDKQGCRVAIYEVPRKAVAILEQQAIFNATAVKSVKYKSLRDI
jgi:hypothetical protein